MWGWGTSFDDEEARAFRAQRVAIYARQVGMFFAVLYVVGAVVVAVVVPEQLISIHLHPAKLAHLAMVPIAFGVTAPSA